MVRMGAIEQKQAMEHDIDDGDQDELLRKVVTRLENASRRSTEVEKIKKEEEEEEKEKGDVVKVEYPEGGCVVVPAELYTALGTMAEANGHTALREEAMDEKATTEGAGRSNEDQCDDMRKIREYICNHLSAGQASDQSPGEPIASDDHAMDTASAGDPEPVHQEAESGIMGDETETNDDLHIDIETVMDAKDHFLTGSEDFDEDFDYDADYILGGEFQVNITRKGGREQ